MTLQQIRYFDALARVGNMRLAADELFISQPSLSAALSNLEKELDLPLLEHRGRTVQLTAQGELFAQHCRRILQEVEEARLHMNSLSEQASHTLRLGYVSPLAGHYVPSLLRKFLDMPENAGTVMNFQCGTTPELVRQLKNGIFDLLLCSHPGDDPELDRRPVLEQPLMLISAPDAPVEVERLEQLSGLPLIGYPADGAMDGTLRWFARKAGVELHFVCRAPNEEAIVALTANHFGCAVVAAVDGLDSAAVHRQLLPGGWGRTIYRVTLKDRRYYGVARRFIRFCEEQD